MPTITPHLWYDTQAAEAAELYTSVFEDSRIVTARTLRDTPAGDSEFVFFELAGQPFQAISAGPMFALNPSISFTVSCATPAEVDTLWEAFIDGGTAMMPLDSYPFSERYGWVADRYGVSWQLMLAPGDTGQKITPSMLFVGEVCGKAEEAIGLYTSVFDDASVQQIQRYPAGMEPDREGTVQYAAFTLAGYRFSAMDSAHDHDFAFNEAVSLMIACDDQAEMDRYWDALSAVPEAEQCGWIKDRFGVSWQIVPRAMDEMMVNADEETLARVTQTFLPMKKLDLAALEAAYAGKA